MALAPLQQQLRPLLLLRLPLLRETPLLPPLLSGGFGVRSGDGLWRRWWSLCSPPKPRLVPLLVCSQRAKGTDLLVQGGRTHLPSRRPSGAAASRVVRPPCHLPPPLRRPRQPPPAAAACTPRLPSRNQRVSCAVAKEREGTHGRGRLAQGERRRLASAARRAAACAASPSPAPPSPQPTPCFPDHP